MIDPMALAATMISVRGTGDGAGVVAAPLTGTTTATLTTEEVATGATYAFSAVGTQTFTSSMTVADASGKCSYDATTNTLTVPATAVDLDEVKITFTGTGNYTGNVVLTVTIDNDNA